MLLTITDIYSRIYKEIVDEITRAEEDAVENDLVTRAITAAEQEARMYLSRYNLTLLFGTAEEAPDVADIFLKSLCTDIACWQLVKLGHPSLQYDHAKTCYDDAIATLKNIQKGNASPEWTYRDTTGQTAPQGNSVAASYNPKRRNSF